MLSQLLSSSKLKRNHFDTNMYICRPTLKCFFDCYQLAYCPIFVINSAEAGENKNNNPLPTVTRNRGVNLNVK